MCRAWMDFERIRYALPEHFYEADAKAGVRLREFEAAKADRALSALDPEQAKALRRANDPTYVEKDKGKKRIRASEPINENANAKRRRGDDAAGHRATAGRRRRTTLEVDFSETTSRQVFFNPGQA